MKVAFLQDYDIYHREEAPAILQFIQILRKDFHLDFYTNEKELFENLDHDVLAISCFSCVELRRLLKIANKAKLKKPDIISIMGGQGVSGLADRIIEAKSIDIVVEGEGELVLPPILKVLEKNLKKIECRKPQRYDGTLLLDRIQKEIFTEDEIELLRYDFISPITDEIAEEILSIEIRRNHKKEKIGNVYIKTPTKIYRSPKKDLAPNNEELNSIFRAEDYPWDIVRKKKYRALSIYAQRGCNWSMCSYCAITTKPGRRIDKKSVIKLIEEAKKHKLKYITFEDDQFLQNLGYVEDICREIVRKGLNKHLYFGCMIRVDAVKNKEILKKLKESNFVKLQIGVESFVKNKIRYFNKTLRGKEEEYIEKAKWLIYSCLEVGIVPGVFIITTAPNSKLIDILKEIETIVEILEESAEKYNILPNFSFNDVLMAYPNAPLLTREKFKKIILPLKRENNRIINLEIPYIFEIKYPIISIFINYLQELSKRRNIPNVNERLEHIEDIILSIEHASRIMTSSYVIVLTFLKELDSGELREFLKSVGFRFENVSDRQLLAYIESLLRKNPDFFLKGLLSNSPEKYRKMLYEVIENLKKEKLIIDKKLPEIKRTFYKIYRKARSIDMMA